MRLRLRVCGSGERVESEKKSKKKSRSELGNYLSSQRWWKGLSASRSYVGSVNMKKWDPTSTLTQKRITQRRVIH